MELPKTLVEVINGRKYCFALNNPNDPNGKLVMVVEGEEGFYPIVEQPANPLEAMKVLNKGLGISDKEQALMIAHSMRKQEKLGMGPWGR